MATNKVIFGDETLIDLTNASKILPEDLVIGKSCYDRTGNRIIGTSRWAEVPTIYASSLNDGKFSSYVSDISLGRDIVQIANTNSVYVYLTDNLIPSNSYRQRYTLNPGNNTINVNAYCNFPCRMTPMRDALRFFKSYKLMGMTPIYSAPRVPLSESLKNKLDDIIISYIYSHEEISEHITISISEYKWIQNAIYPVFKVENSSDTAISQYITFPRFSSSFNKKSINNYNFYDTVNQFNLFCSNPLSIKIPLLNNIFDDKDENYIIISLTDDNKVTVQTPSGTPVNLISAQTALATYSFDICKILYLSGNTFFIIYNWMTSDTARSITYGRIISVNQDGSIYLTTSRTIFAASLADWGVGVAGSCYSGNIFPLNFEDNREVKSLGVTYVRDHLTAANVNTQRTTWQGYYVIYSSTTASRITLLATQASNLVSVTSCVPSTGANIGYLDTLFDGMVHYSTNASDVTTYTTYISRTSATNVGAMGSFIGVGNIKDENDNVIPVSFIGKLDDGNFVAVDGSAIYILQLQFTTTSGASKFKIRQKFTASDTPNELLTYTPDGMIMLRGGILLDRVHGYMYQIMEAPQASNDMYTIQYIGLTNYKKCFRLSENNVLQVARPRGVYSNTFYGINQGEPV